MVHHIFLNINYNDTNSNLRGARAAPEEVELGNFPAEAPSLRVIRNSVLAEVSSEKVLTARCLPCRDTGGRGSLPSGKSGKTQANLRKNAVVSKKS